jgi:ribosomal protein S18 acetylase RimI-like enzyme
VGDEFRSLAEDPERERHLDHALCWLYLANKPYLDWLFDGELYAKEMLVSWMRKDISENSLRNVSLYFRDGEPYGGIVTLTGSDLSRARKADALSILRDVPSERRPGVLDRMKATGNLFSYPGTDEYYLAKMGVVAAARGTGIGKKIFGLGIEMGAAAGFKKFRGDVHVDNAAALRVYQSWGFQVGERRESQASGLAYVPVHLDRSEE